MAVSAFQTGGADKHWLFDPQSIEAISPILQKLVVYDEYFVEESGMTTLSIVLDRILEELPSELEEAVRLVYLAGISYRSAGKIIGVDHKTVKARSLKGVAALRRRLTDTVWLSSLVGGMLPEEIQSPKMTSPEKVFNVLSSMTTIRSDNEG